MRKANHLYKSIIGNKSFRALGVIILIFSFNKVLKGNNVSITGVSITGQNTTFSFSLVNFNITWDNSWRNSTGTNNWDACWVFVKYRTSTNPLWRHATLNYVNGNGTMDGHTVPVGSTINTSPDGKGIMIYRSTANNTNATFNCPGVQLRWNYGVDGLNGTEQVNVCVYAIEMVYVPQGSFFVGDGNNNEGEFSAGTSTTPLQITSEATLTLGGGTPISLGNSNNVGKCSICADDFNNTTTKTLPAAFPKGFNAFYCMKYEISHGQYVAFLNSLTRTQQDARTATNLAVGVTNVTNRWVMTNTSTLTNRNAIRCDAVINNINPITFYCDLNNNGIGNQANDGQDIACGYLSVSDLFAYLDWSAMRPMTELEFEKVCRGDQVPVLGEYAWGSTAILGVTTIAGSGSNSETSSNAGANAVIQGNSPPYVTGPMRVGCLGQTVNTRTATGAGYYGIMNLTDNLFERVVTLGNITGRSFTGLHGNGILTSTGVHDVSGWTIGGQAFRGGVWYGSSPLATVSRRFFSPHPDNTRPPGGGRGVRVCPIVP